MPVTSMFRRDEQVMQYAGWIAQGLVVEALECDEDVASDATVNVGDEHKRVVGVEVRAEERRVTLWSPWGWRDRATRSRTRGVPRRAAWQGDQARVDPRDVRGERVAS